MLISAQLSNMNIACTAVKVNYLGWDWGVWIQSNVYGAYIIIERAYTCTCWHSYISIVQSISLGGHFMVAGMTFFFRSPKASLHLPYFRLHLTLFSSMVGTMLCWYCSGNPSNTTMQLQSTTPSLSPQMSCLLPPVGKMLQSLCLIMYCTLSLLWLLTAMGAAVLSWRPFQP